MSILGTVVRTHPEQLAEVLAQLATLPGLDIALNPGDGRLVVLLEDTPAATAAQTMAAMALLPGVLNASLVYEYSGPDVLPAEALNDTRYQSWRATLTEMAAGLGAGTPPQN